MSFCSIFRSLVHGCMYFSALTYLDNGSSNGKVETLHFQKLLRDRDNDILRHLTFSRDVALFFLNVAGRLFEIE